MCNGGKINKQYTYIMLSVICIASCSFLLLGGVLEGHDTIFHIQRLENLATSIKNGHFRLYVAPDMLNNFGYATSLFYCDFMLYIPAILVCIGMPVLYAYKFLLIRICVLTVISSYYMSKEILDNDIMALFCAAIISCSNYFYTDVFVRGALGESLAFVFVPLIVSGIYNLFYGNRSKWWRLAVGFAGLLMSHILSFLVMCIIFAVLICLYLVNELIIYRKTGMDLKEKKQVLFKAIIAAILGTAWFLLPMREQMLTTEYLSSYFARTYNPVNSAVRIRNLFVEISPQDVLAPGTGLICALFFLLWLCSVFKGRKDKKETFLDYCGIISLLCLFGATSLFPWAKLDPYLNIIQFPWRLHLFTTICISLAGTYWAFRLFYKIIGKHTVKLIIIIAVLQAVSYNINAAQVYTSAVHNNSFVDSEKEYHWYDEQYLHINTNRKLFANRRDYEGYIRTLRYNLEGNCEHTSYGIYTVNFKDNNYRPNSLEMPIHYYYGYSVIDENGNEIPNYPSKGRGWLTVNINNYDSATFTVKYTGTAVQKLSRIISMVFIVTTTVYYSYRRIKGINYEIRTDATV